MHDFIEKTLKEEQELERLAFGTPSDEPSDQDTETPSTTEKQAETLPDEKEMVTPPQKAVTDETQKSTIAQDDWEKRYKNLRNSRNDKLQEASEKLTRSLELVQKLQDENDKLREQLATALSKTDPLEGVFSEEDIEALGDNTVAVIKKATQKITERQTAELQRELEQQKLERKRRAEEELKNARTNEYNTFINTLSDIVPEWDSINRDKGFVEFCHTHLDLDGTLIADNFKKAESRRDATTIARFMLQYKERKAANANPLEEHVTPTGDTASDDSASTKGKQLVFYPKAEIDKFYDDLSRGYFADDPKKADKLDKMYQKALWEGRVRG